MRNAEPKRNEGNGDGQKEFDLRVRTKQYALRIIKLYTSLPNSAEAQVIGRQILRSGTSVAANYREATRGRSPTEFAAKLGIVEQELDETLLWIELLIESEIVAAPKLLPLKEETDELIRIMIASIRSTKKSIQQNNSKK